MTNRPDLLHLSPEALAQIANLGVVKRAVREWEGGYRPALALDAAATLTATFSDGVTTVWPAQRPIQQTQCSCGAASLCRHRIIAALAFRAAAAEQAQAPAKASPGAASDADLAALVSRPLLQTAAQQLSLGLNVEVRREASGEPCDTARLPTATVRFWAGAALAAARCDCLRGAACEHVALGVWAFRLADASQPDAPAATVRLGHAGQTLTLDRAPYWALAEALLRHGVARGNAPLAQALSAAFDAAHALGAVWLAHVLLDIERWSGAYAARSALYQAADGVDWLAELALRIHAGALPGKARAVLGVGLPQETELDPLRLICLGARTLRDGEQRRTRLLLADADTGTRLVLTKEWQVPTGQAAQEAALRAAERLAPGVRLEQLAQGQILSRQAKRLADGSLKLAKARSAQNSVLPQTADWSALGPPLRFERVAELAGQTCAQPNAALSPRHAAGRFVVFSPASVADVFYDPNSQTLAAVLLDADGRAALARRSHEGHLRHALDALAAGFTGQHGPLRHVAGPLRWEHGMAVIEPWALAADRVIVPDFTPAVGALAAVRLGHLPDHDDNPLSRALARLRDWLAELAHHGLSQVPRGWGEDGSGLVRQLRALGLHALAARLEVFVELALAAQANPLSLELAPPLLELLALAQLHGEALAVLGVGELAVEE